MRAKRAELVTRTGKIVGRAKIVWPTHVHVDHTGEEPATHWRVVDLFGNTLYRSDLNTFKGDTVVINLQGLKPHESPK